MMGAVTGMEWRPVGQAGGCAERSTDPQSEILENGSAGIQEWKT